MSSSERMDNEAPVYMPEPENPPPPHSYPAPVSAPVPVMHAEREVIDLGFLFAAMWRAKWFILLAVCFGALVGWYLLGKHKDYYLAEMAVAVSKSGDFAISATQNSGLTGLAEGLGLNIGGETPAGPFDSFQLHIGSKQFAALLQEKYGLIQRIWHGSWDEKSQTWIQPGGTLFEFREDLLRLFRLHTWKPPDLEALAAHLGGTVVVEEHEDLPFMMISYKNLDKDLALEVLQIVHREADNLVREIDRRQSIERKHYIAERLRTAVSPEMRQVLIALLENEEREAISLEGNFTYSGDVVINPTVGNRPLEPNLLTLVGLPIIVAFIAACGLITLIALIRYE